MFKVIPHSCISHDVFLTFHAISWHATYYINASEIPSELSRENFLSSHVRIKCYLHTWRDHRRYGYIYRAFESKLIWYFTGVYIIKRILHTLLWIWILSSSVQLDISQVSAALTREIWSWPLEDKIHIHAWTCNILYLSPLTQIKLWSVFFLFPLGSFETHHVGHFWAFRLALVYAKWPKMATSNLFAKLCHCLDNSSFLLHRTKLRYL